MAEHSDRRNIVEDGVSMDPGRQELTRGRRQYDRQLATAGKFRRHANAASISSSGRQLSTASSQICSLPVSTASTARLLIKWKMFAVMPSLTCSIHRNDFGLSTEGLR